MATVSRGPDVTLISADLKDLTRPERTMPAECGRAAVRLGSPELQFGQVDPFNDKRLTRVLIVRYSRNAFIERVATNQEFLVTANKMIEASGGRGTPGYYSSLFADATLPEGGPVALLDADYDASSCYNGKGAMVFISSMNYDYHKAAIGHANQIELSPDLEVTMPIRVLVDVLESWIELARTL